MIIKKSAILFLFLRVILCIFFLLFFVKVSWVRRRDWHILTSGMFTYTNDERFQVAHTDGGDDWNLQIKYVQKRDNGTYECQVILKKLFIRVIN